MSTSKSREFLWYIPPSVQATGGQTSSPTKDLAHLTITTLRRGFSLHASQASGDKTKVYLIENDKGWSQRTTCDTVKCTHRLSQPGPEDSRIARFQAELIPGSLNRPIA